jgi:5'-methylthioadenosine phosphorylase
MPGLEAHETVTLDTPWGAPSDAFTIGTIVGQRVAFLPRHGRGHRLLPTEVPSRANMHAFKQLGVERVVSVSAVGSLRDELPPGRMVVPDQVVDRTKGVRPFTFFGDGVVAHVAFDQPFCPQLRAALIGAVQQTNQPVADGAALCVMEGPQFSTYAESQWHRQNGWDLIGMTALPEAKLAREAEVCYATLALVTDYDCWHEQHDSVSVDAVVKVLQQNVANAQAVIAALVPMLAGAERTCSCDHALQHAIMTAPEMITPQARARLDLLIGKYVASH